MNEQELRNQIAEDISPQIQIMLENCACLGRDAYGDYITKCKNSIINTIKNEH